MLRVCQEQIGTDVIFTAVKPGGNIFFNVGKWSLNQKNALKHVPVDPLGITAAALPNEPQLPYASCSKRKHGSHEQPHG